MAWTRTSVERIYGRFVSPTTAMVNVTAVNSETLSNDIGAQKIWVGINIVVAGANVVAALDLQTSHDGTTFVTHGTVIADTQPDTTGERVVVYDLGTSTAPYYRLVFNPTGEATLAVGTFQFVIVAFPKDSVTNFGSA